MTTTNLAAAQAVRGQAERALQDLAALPPIAPGFAAAHLAALAALAAQDEEDALALLAQAGDVLITSGDIAAYRQKNLGVK